MFNNLVESGGNTDDLKRKGLSTLLVAVCYAILLLAGAVVSIYMVDAHMENQNLEFISMVAPVPEPTPEVKKPDEPKPKEQPQKQSAPIRTQLQTSLDNPKLVPKEISTAKNTIPPAPPGAREGKVNYDPPPPTGPIGPVTDGDGSGGPVVADNEAPPPPPKPTPAPTPKPVTRVSGGVMNGKAQNLPKPAYPPVAKAAHASGLVVVQVLIGKDGSVLSATAVSGHPLLRQAAVAAARQARFSPTLLTGQPVEVTGTIQYNFVGN